MKTAVKVQKSDLQNLLDLSAGFDQEKNNFLHPASAYEFNEASQLVVPADGAFALPPFDPTDHAFGQLCAKLGETVGLSTLPKNYFTAIDPAVRAGLLNMHLTGSDKQLLVRTYQQNARAFLSDKYGDIFSNTELLDVLAQIDEKEMGGIGKTTRYCDVSPDDLNIRIIWQNQTAPNGGRDGKKPGSWGLGVGISNNETGLRKLRVRPLLKRTSCDNSIIGNIDADEGGNVAVTHVGTRATTLAVKRVSIKTAILNALPAAFKLLEEMIAAEEEKLPNISDVIFALSKEYGWDEATKARVNVGTEGSQTLAGLVNGISFAAHEIVDPNERFEFEVFGGAILVDADSVFSRALQNAERIEQVRK